MVNVLISFKENTVIFKEKKKMRKEDIKYLNTNIISFNELIFSIEYIEANQKIMEQLIKNYTKDEIIDTVVIQNINIVVPILHIIKNNSNIINLIINDDKTLSYSAVDIISKSYIKNLNCYNLQPFMLDILDKKNIIVELRGEILYSSQFMSENNLHIYSSLFYKITLKLTLPFSEDDEEDFKSFCNINKYLKTIHINNTSKNDLENIVNILKTYNRKNIKIIIHENISDYDTIEYLKKYNKKYASKNNIYFKIAYSNKYIRENLLKQANMSILRTCSILILFIMITTITYVFYDNYNSINNDNKIKNDLQKVISISHNEEIIDKINEEVIEKNIEVINNDIASLVSVNPDVIGWINVKGTKIDYPVVQSKNNEFYLKHNIYSEYDNNGWPFLDYRNDYIELNDNTLVFAHNRYSSGIMFGTLQDTLKKNWYDNPENHIITFNTLFKNYQFKVFSIYKIEKTSDYMTTNYSNDANRILFYNMLKERSSVKFDTKITAKDKIITLSTCADNDHRILLHAVLLNEN